MNRQHIFFLTLLMPLASSCKFTSETLPPPPIECPLNTSMVGNSPPIGNRQFCINPQTNLQHGPWRFYFPNGQLQREGFYFAGTKHGRFSHWNSHGNKTSEGYYRHDKKIGVWKEWTKDGKLRTETPYEDNEIHGYRYFFYNNGNKSAEFTYIRGFIVSRQNFPNPGQPKTKDDEPFVEDPSHFEDYNLPPNSTAPRNNYNYIENIEELKPYPEMIPQ